LGITVDLPSIRVETKGNEKNDSDPFLSRREIRISKQKTEKNA
jgi:hypothetical protein